MERFYAAQAASNKLISLGSWFYPFIGYTESMNFTYSGV